MAVIRKHTLVHILCDKCAKEYRNSGLYNIKMENIFIICFEYCENCKTHKGFYYSMEKRVK